MLSIGRDILGNLKESSRLEWLVTNGIGGFASSSVTGMNTRRYHGLLIAARRPPTERLAMVSRLEESLLVDGHEVFLSTNRYQKALYPAGYLHLERFDRDPLPTWTFQFEDILIVKTLFMVYGENTTVITYKVFSNGREVELRLRPHMLFRDFHGNTFENPGFEDNTAVVDTFFSLQPFANAPALYMSWERGSFVREPFWYRDNHLQEEESRGLNALEDDYSNGYLRVLKCQGTISVSFSLTPPAKNANALELRKREEMRLEAIAQALQSEDLFLQRLLLAADQFIVDRHSTRGKTIIAGYPWFSDWGRDSLISLPGLTLIPGRFDEARAILRTFAQSVREGLVPNCFADVGTDAMYNSVDASLWFFFAVYKFLEYTDDEPFVLEHLSGAMQAILDGFMNGTRFQIRMDPEDGLISAGESGIQLTWMDAKVDGLVVTPRQGKPVEVNALWYNALRIFELVQNRAGADTREISALARKVRISFRKTFLNEDMGYLYDVIAPDGTPDHTFRPNQIFAVYLPFSLLEPHHEHMVVDAVFRRLYTSYGLRSLPPKDPQYLGLYRGDRLHRDKAYHQGTVWAYLIGPFITSYLKVQHHSMEAQLRASYMLEPLRTHLEREGCLGSISEVFDGDPPHSPKGCFAQAWSIAEVLRCYVEDIKGQRPNPLS